MGEQETWIRRIDPVAAKLVNETTFARLRENPDKGLRLAGALIENYHRAIMSTIDEAIEGGLRGRELGLALKNFLGTIAVDAAVITFPKDEANARHFAALLMQNTCMHIDAAITAHSVVSGQR